MKKCHMGIGLLLIILGSVHLTAQELSKRSDSVMPGSLAYVGQPPPREAPVLFAPGIVSLPDRFETYPTFSANGEEMFFSVVNADWTRGEIWHTKVENGVWTGPTRAPFSDEHSINWESFMALDSTRMYFASNRRTSPASGMDIWMVERGADEIWSAPVRLSDSVNSGADDGSACVTSDGTLYFHSNRGGGFGSSELFRSRFVGGTYSRAENLGGVIPTEAKESEPYMAPDESYLIFISQTRAGGKGGWDLWICFRSPDSSWTQPVNLGAEINTSDDEYGPRVTDDGKYLFFTRENRGRSMDIYWVSAAVIDRLRTTREK
jgi:Tol biopolymer transport system component